MPWNEDSGETFGSYMRGGEPLGGRTADAVVGERTHVTRDQVVEWRTDDGARFKATRDQGGHIVTEETTASGRQRKHVTINLG